MEKQITNLYKSVYNSPFGRFILVSDDQNLLKVYPTEEPVPTMSEPAPIQLVRTWLDSYFSGKNPTVDGLPIQVHGTPFQERCWQLLLKIPYGSTTTYKSIADEVAKFTPTDRMSCQAVGQAISKNPIAIIIPCHRVIGSNGKLTGYSGGLELKRDLLNHEKAMNTAL